MDGPHDLRKLSEVAAKETVQPGSDYRNDIGHVPKFLAQRVRWARKSWRSNTVSVFVEGIVWRRYPWCGYAIYLTLFCQSCFGQTRFGLQLQN